MNRFPGPVMSIALSLLILLPLPVAGQTLEFSEELVEALSENEQISKEAIPQVLERVDINSSELGLLVEAGLMSPIQESALQLYSSVNGSLISLYELQAVPFFDMGTIRRILPFVRIGAQNISLQKLNKSLASGKNEVQLRLRHTIQKQEGYREDGPYVGSRQGLFIRYLHTGKRVSFGLLAEKDPGEAWLDKANKHLLDFNSFHLRVIKPLPWVDEMILGDFNISFGSGLIMNSSFRSGKSAMTSNIYAIGRPMRPLRSAREYNFLRGIGLILSPHSRIGLYIAASTRKIDATIRSEISTTPHDTVYINSISSLAASGLHRTESEQMRKTSTNSNLFGISVRGDLGKLNFQLSSVYQSTTLPVRLSTGSEQGKSTLNSSINLRYLLRNALIFTEAGMDEDRRISFISGAIIPISKLFDVAVLYRRLHPDYEHRGARTFAENTEAENETGLYTGVEITPIKHFRINAYTDFWRHPVARFGIDFPGTGHEQLVRVTYSIRKKFEFYAQWRSETKEYNARESDARITQLANRTRQYIRIHYARKLNRNFELRNRIEFSIFKSDVSPPEKGILFIQDILYKPLGKPFSITSRLAYFDTQSYNARIYAYENDLSYQFSIPAYAGNGTRFYFNIKYKGIRNLTIEFRAAHTQMFDRNSIGSGNDEIIGSGKTDIKVQVAFRF